LRRFNFREKLEEKNKRSRKCFEFLNKRCKTKKSEGAMCKKHRHSSKRIEIPGGAPAPPHYYEAPPLVDLSRQPRIETMMQMLDFSFFFFFF
jgi:hypothetical protein